MSVSRQFDPDADAYLSAGSSPPRLIRFKVRFNNGFRTIFLNPSDISRLLETDDGETRIYLRSEVCGSSEDSPGTSYVVRASIERVAARINRGARINRDGAR